MLRYLTYPFQYPITFYNWMMSKSDPRTSEWPLLGSPFPILTLIVLYVYFVLIYTTYHFLLQGGSLSYLSGKFNWVCEPISYATDPETMTLVRLGWWYLLLKIAEFLDTMFFVFRKKFTHISALHVTHHSLIAWGVWIGMKFGAGGQNAFFPFVNCFVHMIMYAYYCLAALGPHMKPYLWWKKYITIIQMVQFVIIGLHAVVPLFFGCDFHPGFAYAILAHAIFFLVMFLNFYIHAYVKRKEQDHAREVLKKKNEDHDHHNGTKINGYLANGFVRSENISLENGTVLSRNGHNDVYQNRNVHNRKQQKEE
ncbi:elongation of very long chain fatty acids protein 1-like [Limulus polyphemus]|uniref:Elongation of very long chain fatty acids protein n=1 Tax=Limulus polyphemus TaxID=6850 RepID=A0ABM1BYG8_LIMPO|nr:elongation of very long chain fatty acids protein 1-like [Limulus polyphemus]